jgi:nitrogen regulatory protein PII
MCCLKQKSKSLSKTWAIKEVIDTIAKTACTNMTGDGEIFVSTVDDAIQIRAGERGIAVSACYLNCATTFLLLS